MVFEGFGSLGGLLGRLLGHLKPSWGGLGTSCRHVVLTLAWLVTACGAGVSLLTRHVRS